LFFDQYDTQVGVVGVLAGPAGVRRTGWRLSAQGASIEPDELVQIAIGQLREYFAGQRTVFDVPVRAVAGTAFQRAVWSAIAEVAYGTTLTYKALAQRAGFPDSIRAVGAATGRNPITIVVPCHRIVGSDGALHGYAGGLGTKRALLALEEARAHARIEQAMPA
jgi:methylated-DNA-[protein]-cysteine S-methyltransferase